MANPINRGFNVSPADEHPFVSAGKALGCSLCGSNYDMLGHVIARRRKAGTLPENPFVAHAWNAEVGGGEVGTFIEREDGLVTVVAFGMVGTYRDAEHYLNGEEPPLALVVLTDADPDKDTEENPS